MMQDPKLSADDARLREELKRAVRSVEAPDYLATRIRARIRAADERRPSFFSMRLLTAATAAALVIGVGVTVAYQLGHLRFTVASQESYISRVLGQVAAVMQVGLGDHIHCAVFRHFPEVLPKGEQLTEKMEPEYAELVAIAQEHAPEGFEVALAHHCGYRGRRFVHVALKRGSELMSFVVTRQEDGETFESSELTPALLQSGASFFQQSTGRFELAGFEASGHLVYVISELSQEENMKTMVAAAPRIRRMLGDVEI